MKEIIKELKELNKILLSMKNFQIAELQLIKQTLLYSQSQDREIKKIKKIMEEKWQV